MKSFPHCRISLLMLSFALAGAVRGYGQDLSNASEIKPFTMRGAVSLSLSGYGENGLNEPRRSPFSWTLIGSPVATLYGIQLPFTFVFSEKQRDYRQPFNQIGVSPKYKSLTGHFGYRTMNMSRYTLAGVNFLGAGLEIKPEPLRFAIMTGSFQKAIQEDTSNKTVIPTFARSGYAAKLGVGSERNYFDINYLHALDDTNSLKRRLDTNGFLLYPGVIPKENAVAGIATKVTVIDELSVDLEAAASATTALTQVIATDSEKRAVGVPTFVDNLITLRHDAVTVRSAMRGGINFAIPHFGLRLGYDRIERDFSSMGAYYFTSDAENITVAPTFDLLDGKVRISGSVGKQKDNLPFLLINVKNDRPKQTDRWIGSGALTWNPSSVFGIDAQFSNYNTSQSALKVTTDTSTLARNVSRNFSLAPRLVFQSPTEVQYFSISTALQNYTDLHPQAGTQTDSRTVTVSANYNVTFVTSRKSLGASVVYSDTKSGALPTSILGLGINGSLALLENKILASASLGLSSTKVAGASGLTLNQSINGTYRVTPEDSFVLSILGTENSGEIGTQGSFQEYTVTLGYTRTFSF